MLLRLQRATRSCTSKLHSAHVALPSAMKNISHHTRVFTHFISTAPSLQRHPRDVAVAPRMVRERLLRQMQRQIIVGRKQRLGHVSVMNWKVSRYTGGVLDVL
jgi:hypothetical protein